MRCWWGTVLIAITVAQPPGLIAATLKCYAQHTNLGAHTTCLCRRESHRFSHVSFVQDIQKVKCYCSPGIRCEMR
eukprot:scaffold261780_cov17-Tisochrysis_lutea.AAC.1